MDAVQYANYLDILKKELIPAMGCTEPIAVAYATAKAAQVLGVVPGIYSYPVAAEILSKMQRVQQFLIPAG